MSNFPGSFAVVTRRPGVSRNESGKVLKFVTRDRRQPFFFAAAFARSALMSKPCMTGMSGSLASSSHGS